MYVTPEYNVVTLLCDLDRTIVVREQWTGARLLFTQIPFVPALEYKDSIGFAEFHPILERVSSGVSQNTLLLSLQLLLSPQLLLSRLVVPNVSHLSFCSF